MHYFINFTLFHHILDTLHPSIHAPSTSAYSPFFGSMTRLISIPIFLRHTLLFTLHFSIPFPSTSAHSYCLHSISIHFCSLSIPPFLLHPPLLTLPPSSPSNIQLCLLFFPPFIYLYTSSLSSPPFLLHLALLTLYSFTVHTSSLSSLPFLLHVHFSMYSISFSQPLHPFPSTTLLKALSPPPPPTHSHVLYEHYIVTPATPLPLPPPIAYRLMSISL